MNFEHIDFETYDIFDPTQQGPLDPAIVALLDQVDWKAELPPADTTWPTGDMALAGQHPVITPPVGDDITAFLTADWSSDLAWLRGLDLTTNRSKKGAMPEMGESTGTDPLVFQYGSVPAQAPSMSAMAQPAIGYGYPDWSVDLSDFTIECSGSTLPEQTHFTVSEGGASTSASTSALKSSSSNGKKRKRTAEPTEVRMLYFLLHRHR